MFCSATRLADNTPMPEAKPESQDHHDDDDAAVDDDAPSVDTSSALPANVSDSEVQALVNGLQQVVSCVQSASELIVSTDGSP